MFESVNTDKFNPWPIYHTLMEHFPVGLMRRTEAEGHVYRSYPGLRKYSQALDRSIHRNDTYKTVWGTFEQKVQKHFQKEVVGTTYGQAPCYSCYIRLLAEDSFNLSHFFDLKVFVSVIGPYYTILGTDWCEVKLNNYYNTLYYLVSPLGSFRDYFSNLESLVEESFPDHSFVPHWFYNSPLANTMLPFSEEETNVVFNGLFNHEYRPGHNIYGDEYYRSDNWIRDDYVDSGGGWTAYPPTGG